MKVLLVEDDQWLAECYLGWLAKAGFTAYWASDAQSALDVLDDQSCSAIVVDLFLPGANGIQLLQVLASYADTKATPVIVCSGALPAQDVDWAAYGVVATLDKTVLDRTQFINAIIEASA